MPSARSTIALTADCRQAGYEPGEELAHRRRRERLKVERDEVALAGTPVGTLLEELRASQRDDVDRDVLAPLEEVIDEVEQPGVGEVEVLEDEDDRSRGGEALEERPPGGEELLRAARRGLDPEQGEQGRLDPAPLRLIGDVAREGLGDLRPGRRLVVGLEQPAAFADHLAERPEADPLAVGRRAAVVPPDGVHQAVDVLQELPGQSCLADPGGADDRHEAGPPVPACRVEELLEHPQLIVAADERGLERLAPVPATDLGDDPERPPGGHRARLALERLLAGLLERDRLGGRPLGRLADEDGAGLARPTGASRRC